MWASPHACRKARTSKVIDRKSTRLNSRSRLHLVCRLLLEKKKNKKYHELTATHTFATSYRTDIQTPNSNQKCNTTDPTSPAARPTLCSSIVNLRQRTYVSI